MRLRVARLIDGSSETARSDVYLEFDDKITGVESGAPIGDSADDYTLLPGLIDSHVHLTLSGERFVWWRNELSDAYYAFEAANNAKAQLDNGVTTVRDVGGIRDVAIELSRAIAKGTATGPKIYSSGRWLTVSGGHGSIYANQADGPAAFRNAARSELHAGAALIKVMATAGALAEEGRNPYSTEIGEDELEAIAGVTRAAGVPLAVHAHSDEGILLGLKHGATSIEHGTWLSDQAIEIMASRDDVWLVPTLAVMHRVASDGNKEQAEIVARMLDVKMPQLEKAIKSGVKIAVGTDAGAPGTDHGLAHYEAELLVAAGMTNMQAIQSATSEAGQLVTGGTRGVISQGSFADFVIVRGNPLEDITALTQVECVISNGEVVRGAVPRQMEVTDGL